MFCAPWPFKGYFCRFPQSPFSVTPSRCSKCNLGTVPGSLFKIQNVQYFLHAAGNSGLAWPQGLSWVQPQNMVGAWAPVLTCPGSVGHSWEARTKPTGYTPDYLLPCCLWSSTKDVPPLLELPSLPQGTRGALGLS
jgi:hypothetical protein